MAGQHSDYVHGTMGVEDHKKTFSGFMGVSVYGGAAIALIVIFPTLVFGTSMGWLTALIVTLIIGIILGVALKLKAGWYAGIIASAIPVGIASWILSILTAPPA